MVLLRRVSLLAPVLLRPALAVLPDEYPVALVADAAKTSRKPSPVLLDVGDAPPPLLRVSVPIHAPLGPQSCQGEYELLDVRSHGAPVWKQWAGNRYLFQCDLNGSWFIGNDEHLLESCEGLVVSSPTLYSPPDFSELDWAWPGAAGQTSGGELTDGGAHPSDRMSVIATGPPRMLDVRVCGHKSLSGAFALLLLDGLRQPSSAEQPMPAWGQVDGDVYIYFCASEHTWYFNDRVAMENRECSGLIRPTAIYGAPLPDQIRSWDLLNASGWFAQPGCISVEESPFFEMRDEVQSMVHRLARVAGLVVLLLATSRCMVQRCVRACCTPGRSSAVSMGRVLVEPLLAFRQQRRSEADRAEAGAEGAVAEAMIAEGTVGSGTCVICFDRPAIMTFVHGRTGHKACCPQCARQIPRKKCPVCRQTFSSVVLTYSV